ncbi:hypothetical protein [Delftia acidovorans]|jgi:hypothetical protein|uniref:hypothetical protein n=1 Tax=Delftia acidovorans TaxID=80866 RepID=UPI00333E671C
MNDPLPPSHFKAALALLLSNRQYVLMAYRQRVMVELLHNRQARELHMASEWPSAQEREAWEAADSGLRKSLRSDLFRSLGYASLWVAISAALVMATANVKWDGAKYTAGCAAVFALWATLFQLRPSNPSHKGKRLDEVLRGKLTLALAVLAGFAAFRAALVA